MRRTSNVTSGLAVMSTDLIGLRGTTLFAVLDSSRNRWAVAFIIPGALFAALFGLFAFFFGAGWWSILIGIVASAVVGAVLFSQAESITARSIGSASTPGSLHPRLENLLESLCALAGVPEPTVYMVNAERPDAAVFGTSAMRGNLAVTNGLLNTLTVVQLEGVLARELARLRNDELRWDTLAVSMIRLPLQPFGSFGRELVQWARGTDVSVQDDLAAVDLTRYPPGLSEALRVMERGALEKGAADKATAPDSSGDAHGGSDRHSLHSITSHLWVIGNAAGNLDQAGLWSIDDRIEVLNDLA